MSVSWTRLCRFKAADGSIHYGEPILTSDKDLMSNNVKQAKVIEGGIFGQVTDKVVDVQEVGFRLKLALESSKEFPSPTRQLGGL